jgi:ketosteroid isomerase-like protein
MKKAITAALALHYLPNVSGNNVWVVVGTYDLSLENRNDNWKITGMKFNLQKQDGNLQLSALAGQKVKDGTAFKTYPVTDDNKAVIEKFFSGLEKLDIPSFLDAWADDGRQLMPLSPDNFPKELNGKAAIHNQYRGLPDAYSSMKFPRKYSGTDIPDQIIVQYSGIIPLKDGKEYNNNYVGIFRISNGKISQFTEYFDPFILQESFGTKLESNFNVRPAAIAGKCNSGVKDWCLLVRFICRKPSRKGKDTGAWW